MCEDDSDSMHRLLCLLHHRPDPGSYERLVDVKDEDLATSNLINGADSLRRLAIVIDKYQCQEALKNVSESLLSDFTFPSVRDAIRFDSTLRLVAAAYLLRQPRFFRLFTKRLVTDYADDLDEVQFWYEIPHKQALLIRSELEKQSFEAYTELDRRIQSHTTDQSRCVKGGTICVRPPPRDALLVQRIIECVVPPGEKWPSDRSSGITLRHLLHGLYHLERIQRISWCAHHRVRTYGSVGPEDFVRICMWVDKLFVTGLCLGCTRDGKACDCDADSVPHAGAIRRVYRDSFLFGAGPAYEDRSKYGLTGREGSPGYE